MGLNRVELSGGLVREPIIKALDSGALVCEFSLGCHEAFWSAQEKQVVARSNYFGCVAWGDLASYVAEHFHQRDEVLVLGQLTQETWEDRAGQEKSKTKVRVLQISPIRRARSEPEPDF